MSAADAVARLLTLTPWLLERPGASVAEAAAAFDVSEADIRADLDRLDWCGLPGMGGGDVFDITLTNDRIVVEVVHELHRPMRLHPAEALRLVLTLDTVTATMGDDLPALTTARQKVRDAAGVPDGIVVTAEDHDPVVLATIRRAIAGGRRLTFAYQGRNDDTPRQRVVDVWQLDVTEDGWYVRAHDVDAEGARSFRLDRIHAPSLLEEPATTTPPTDLPPPGFPDDTGTLVRLRLAPGAAWLADTVRVLTRERTDDDVEITFTTDALGWIAGQLRIAGPDARVLEPASLADRVRASARDALAAHDTA